MIRIAIFVALVVAPARAETLTCSTWQGIAPARRPMAT